MSPALILAFTLFAISATATPGPNNVMLTASGATFGFRRTLAHMAGISVGFPAMVAAVGFGLGTVFLRYPAAHTVLKYAGSFYLLWLAWRIATATATQNGDTPKGRPLTFVEAALFQWVNPKAWIMAASAIATYTSIDGNLMLEITVITLIFFGVALPSVSLWTMVGVGAARLLKKPGHLKTFNIVMAGLLVASIVPIVWPD